MSLTLKYSLSRPIMGTTAAITVLAEHPESHVEVGMKMLNELHNLWSRFLSTSDISRINVANGEVTFVSPRTMHLIRCMRAANVATNGFYNPTLLPIQHKLGDNMSIQSDDISVISLVARPYKTLDEIEILDQNHVRIPADMSLDAGGIGKGLAADLVTNQLILDGALSVSVNIGGDVRVGCSPTYDHDWNIDVTNYDKKVVSTVQLRNGAVATSSTSARSSAPSHISSHVLRVDDVEDSRKKSASVISSEAMWAEVWTKYVMLSPQPFTDLEETGQSALFAVEGNEIEFSQHWKDFVL